MTNALLNMFTALCYLENMAIQQLASFVVVKEEKEKKAFSIAAPQRSTSHTAAALYVRECEEKRICKSIPANSVVVTYRRIEEEGRKNES